MPDNGTIATLIILPLIVSILANLVYGLLLRRREDRFLKHLSASRSKRAHKRAVNALFRAATGQPNRLSLVLILGIYALVSLSLWMMMLVGAISADFVIGTRHDELQDMLSELRSLETRLEQTIDPESAASQDTPEDSLAWVRSAITEVEEALGDLHTQAIDKVSDILPTVYLAAALYGLISSILDARRSYIEQYYARVLPATLAAARSLSTKPELKELALRQAKVEDEASLRSLIDCMRSIAERNDVPGLIEKLDLWKYDAANVA